MSDDCLEYVCVCVYIYDLYIAMYRSVICVCVCVYI
jgi:hypothetical protein